MEVSRREFLASTAFAMLAETLGAEDRHPMYGLIGRIKTQPGKRDELASVLLQGTEDMPGCLSYLVANDPADPDALWVTEVWRSAELHKASLALPSVKDAIAKGRPFIAGFDQQFETEPIGGHGLSMG